MVWSTTIAVVVSVAAGLGLVLTSGDALFVTAAPNPSTEPSTTTTSSTTRNTATSVDTRTNTSRSVATSTVTSTVTTTTGAPVAAKIDATAAAATTTMPASTLTAGSPKADIAELQRQLNLVTGSAVELDGVYGAGTRAAVVNFQTVIGVPATGLADAVTRWKLAEAANKVILPTIGAGGINGCQVAVIGDSLMAGSEPLHVDALARVGCAAAVDGEGGRSLAYGWQCRVDRDGRRPLLLFEDRIPGNETCAPSGLTLLASWADAAALGDVVVIALGTNDSGLYDKARWEHNWAEALRLAGGRPVVFVTTQAGPGSSQFARQGTYAAALRQWCSGQRLCVLAEWANTAAAADASSYVDTVHLNGTGTRARAAFIAEVVAALLTGQPIPNPQPPPTPAIPPAETTTTVATAPMTSTTSTTAPSSSTTTTTTSAPTTSAPATTTTPVATTTSSTTTTTTSTTTTTTTLAGPPDSVG